LRRKIKVIDYTSGTTCESLATIGFVLLHEIRLILCVYEIVRRS
jgi:hypothetical protein